FGFLTGVLLLVACASGAQPQGVNLGNTAGEAAEEVGIQPEEPAVQEPAQEPSEAPADAPTDAPAEAPAQQPTSGTSLLQEVQQRGVLRCGVNAALPGFGSIDADGNNVGFDVDFCHAIAAALFGDADAVECTTLQPIQRFQALQVGHVEHPIRNTSMTR